MTRAFRVAALVVVFGSAGCGGQCDSAARVEKRMDALEARFSALESKGSASTAIEGPAPTLPAAPQPATTAAARRTLETLRTERMTVDFTNVSVPLLLQVIVERLPGTSVMISMSVSKITTPVTLKLHDGSVHDALDLLASETPMRWTIHESGTLRITTADEK